MDKFCNAPDSVLFSAMRAVLLMADPNHVTKGEFIMRVNDTLPTEFWTRRRHRKPRKRGSLEHFITSELAVAVDNLCRRNHIERVWLGNPKGRPPAPWKLRLTPLGLKSAQKDTDANISAAKCNYADLLCQTNGNYSLTASQVKEIRLIYQPRTKANGCVGLAERFGVAKNTIWRIVHGHSR